MPNTSRISTALALATPIHIGPLNTGWCHLSPHCSLKVLSLAQPPFRVVFSEVHLPGDRDTKDLELNCPMTRLPKSSNVSHTSPRTMVYLQIRSSGMPPSLLPSLCPNLVTLDGAMSPIVNLPQDKPACDQYIHAFIPRNVITSNIYSSTIARPRARR